MKLIALLERTSKLFTLITIKAFGLNGIVDGTIVIVFLVRLMGITDSM